MIAVVFALLLAFAPLSEGEAIAAVAEEHIGAPYLWGGASDSGFDCSGYVQHVYAAAGLDLPSRWIPTLAELNPIEYAELERGDLVIFAGTYKPGYSHIAIYLGDGKIAHAAGEWSGVIVSDLSRPYYQAHYAGASRPWAD